MTTKTKRMIPWLILAIIILIGGWLFYEAPLLDVSLSLPSEVELGGTVKMIITATNNHAKTVTLDSIDVSDSFLAGFQIIEIKPIPEDTLHLSTLDMRSWEFSQAVPPEKSVDVCFELKPIHAGHYTGDIDVCNPNQDFKTIYADIIIKE